MKTFAALPIFFLSVLSLPAQQGFDLQGHRGCRGLLPENTIPAFIRAMDIGVTTLELDVVMTADGQVVVSHEPWMNHATCTDSSGNPIRKENEKDFRIYRMTASQVSKFDCGSKGHPDFPRQQKMQVSKPLLSDMIAAVESYITAKKLPPVRYNIEIKSSADGDGINHPEIAAFTEAVVKVIRSGGIENRMIIQSFDLRPLQYLHVHYPALKTALLISNVKSMKANVRSLGFVPQVYSPNYLLVSKKLVRQTQRAGMLLIPWTVNDPKQMARMVALGVDGLITDYPDIAAELLKK